MKRRILLGLIVCLALCCLFGTAMAAYDPLKVSMSLSQNKFTETQSITVSITVSNTGEGDMPGPVTLYYPNGKQVEEFGSPTRGQQPVLERHVEGDPEAVGGRKDHLQDQVFHL